MIIRQVLNNFVHAINGHSVNEVIALMTDDHKFIDSFGIELTGKDGLKRAWGQYFKMFPDYNIQIQEILTNNNNAVIIGTAFGTYTEDGTVNDKFNWTIPAAWHAQVEGKRIKSWRIYADVTPIVEAIGKYKESIKG